MDPLSAYLEGRQLTEKSAERAAALQLALHEQLKRVRDQRDRYFGPETTPYDAGWRDALVELIDTADLLQEQRG